LTVTANFTLQKQLNTDDGPKTRPSSTIKAAFFNGVGVKIRKQAHLRG
jgi:hypothetical protein